MLLRLLSILCFVSLNTEIAEAAIYYCDPVKGSRSAKGTRDNPWGKFEEVANKVRSGDTVVLRTGHHGALSLRGDNDKMTTIIAAPGTKATFTHGVLSQGSNWTIKGLTFSPSLAGGDPYDFKAYGILLLAESGPTKNVIVEDCYIYGVESREGLGVKEWMSLPNAIFNGRHGDGVITRNNYVRNVRFGISANGVNALSEGNVVVNFSADAYRATRDGVIHQYNVVRNNFVSEADGDKNHDDGFQTFLFNRGTGRVNDQKFIGNIIRHRDSQDLPYQNNLQGIGLFDGPLYGFEIRDNVIDVEMWHGIALFDGISGFIENNYIINTKGGRFTPWIELGSKLGQASTNTVQNNFAHRFNLKQPNTTASNNNVITSKIFSKALQDMNKLHEEKFGRYHPASGYARLTDDRLEGDELRDYWRERSEDNQGADEKAKDKKSTKEKKKERTASTKSFTDADVQKWIDSLPALLTRIHGSTKKKIAFDYKVMRAEAEVRSVGEQIELYMPKLGSSITVNIFKGMKKRDAYSLAKGIAAVAKSDEEANAMVAALAAANNLKSKGERAFLKSGKFKDELIQTFGY